jgi:glutathione S-transferase
MLELYHHRTAVCPRRARLALTEKGLGWTGHIVNIRMGEKMIGPGTVAWPQIQEMLAA